jgi:hypothetical protein
VPLKEFLHPSSILDCRMPDWRQDEPPTLTRLFIRIEELVAGLARQQNTVFVEARVQDQHAGSQLYNALEDYRIYHQLSDLSLPLLPKVNLTAALPPLNDRRHFRRVFRSLWSVLLTPAPAVAAELTRRQDELGLRSSSTTLIPYVAAHVRAL